MSLRGELLRLAARCFIKPGNQADVGVAAHRRQAVRFERWVPTPPSGTETIDTALGGVAASRIATPGARAGRHILYLHGGGYIAGSPALYQHLTWRLAAAGRARISVIDYRLAPEHPFPAALDDADAAWRGLLAEGVDSRQCVVMGDSAGGGLALALMLKLRDRGAPLPAAAVALSPWTDLAITGASCRRNATADPMLNGNDLRPLAAHYLGGADPGNPYASPLYGDPRGLPPTLFQVGSDEVLLDDSVRMAERMRDGGCAVTLEIWPRMPHVWQAFVPFLPEAGRAIARIGAFVRHWAGDPADE